MRIGWRIFMTLLCSSCHILSPIGIGWPWHITYHQNSVHTILFHPSILSAGRTRLHIPLGCSTGLISPASQRRNNSKETKNKDAYQDKGSMGPRLQRSNQDHRFQTCPNSIKQKTNTTVAGLWAGFYSTCGSHVWFLSSIVSGPLSTALFAT